jgi:hypothetical protein
VPEERCDVRVIEAERRESRPRLVRRQAAECA